MGEIEYLLDVFFFLLQKYGENENMVQFMPQFGAAN